MCPAFAFREALPIFLWPGNKCAFCPGGRHYLCFSRLSALQTSLRRLSGVKAVTRQVQMLWELSPYPRATMMHCPVKAFRMSFKLNLLSSLWRLREHFLIYSFTCQMDGRRSKCRNMPEFFSVTLFSYMRSTCRQTFENAFLWERLQPPNHWVLLISSSEYFLDSPVLPHLHCCRPLLRLCTSFSPSALVTVSLWKPSFLSLKWTQQHSDP